MRRKRSIGLLALLAAACDNSRQATPTNQPAIKVRADEQEQLHKLDAFNLAIGLKRAIYDAGFTCKRITDAGFVSNWQNLEMWTAHCVYDKGASRDWAIFVFNRAPVWRVCATRRMANLSSPWKGQRILLGVAT